MKHISNTRKLVSGVAMLALLLAGALVSQSSSQAAGLPTVRYVSPDFNAANETFESDRLGQYYATGGRSFFKYVGAGSTITITYLITSDGTAPAADKAVSFMVNAPYSGSKASWEVNGNAVGASSDSATGYGLLVAGKTDASGKVSFTIKNTNTADSAMAIPASETQARALVGRLYGNMKLVIDGLNDMQQVVDLLTFDITKAPADAERIAAEKAAADKAAADKAAADKAAADKAAADKAAADKAAADKAAADKAAADKAAADKAAADKAAADKAAADKAAADKAAADKAAADKAAADKAAADKAAADKAAAEKEAADKAAANMTQAEREAAEKAAADKAAADKAAADKAAADKAAADKAAADKAAADKAAADKAAADKAAADKAAADKAAADKAAADKAAADKAAADKAAADKAAADKLVKQTISSVSSSIKVGKTLMLPARSVSGLAIKWVSNTKSTCTISGTKLTGKKKGSCSITGKNAGNSNNAALAITKKLTVK